VGRKEEQSEKVVGSGRASKKSQIHFVVKMDADGPLSGHAPAPVCDTLAQKMSGLAGWRYFESSPKIYSAAKQRALREETHQGNTQVEWKCRLSGVFSG
jgi:hypothetical protein